MVQNIININNMYIIGIFFFILIIMTITMLKTKILITMLLLLEMIMLMMLMLILYLSKLFIMNFFIITLLCMGACEACVGLALLVMTLRSHGNDYVFPINFNNA